MYPNKRIFIPINSLSALIGRHPYRDQYEETVSVISRYYPDIYKTLQRIYNSEECHKQELKSRDLMPKLDIDKTYKENFAILTNEVLNVKDEKVIDSHNISLELESKLEKSLIEDNIVESGEARSKMDNLMETIKDSDSYTVKLARNNIKQFKYKYLGKKRENGTVKKLLEIKKDIRSEQRIFKLDTTSPDGIEYRLYGKIDGIEYIENKEYAIVEIKNRMLRFQVPSYDLDQLAMYIYISNYPRGYLVQQLHDEIKIGPELSYEEAKTRYDEHIKYYMHGWITMMNELPREYSDNYNFDMAGIAMNIFEN